MFNENELNFDPLCSPFVQLFLQIQRQVECPFAKNAKIWGGSLWNLNQSLEENIEHNLPLLNCFIQKGESEQLDGFVFSAPHHFGYTIEELAHFTRNVLQILSLKDPARGHCMAKIIESFDWQFNYLDTNFFVSTFAPCYPKSHPRYNFGTQATFLFLQPEFSLKRHGIIRGTKATEKIGKSIRKIFAENKRDYDHLSIMESPFEAVRYLKPVTYSDNLWKWWEATHDLENF